MREIRPYGSEGGGGETLPTPIRNPLLSVLAVYASPLDIHKPRIIPDLRALM